MVGSILRQLAVAECNLRLRGLSRGLCRLRGVGRRLEPRRWPARTRRSSPYPWRAPDRRKPGPRPPASGERPRPLPPRPVRPACLLSHPPRDATACRASRWGYAAVQSGFFLGSPCKARSKSSLLRSILPRPGNEHRGRIDIYGRGVEPTILVLEIHDAAAYFSLFLILRQQQAQAADDVDAGEFRERFRDLPMRNHHAHGAIGGRGEFMQGGAGAVKLETSGQSLPPAVIASWSPI